MLSITLAVSFSWYIQGNTQTNRNPFFLANERCIPKDTARLVLCGISSSEGGEKYALIKFAGTSTVVRLNDSIHAYTISEIHANYVVVTKDKKTIYLRLGKL